MGNEWAYLLSSPKQQDYTCGEKKIMESKAPEAEAFPHVHTLFRSDMRHVFKASFSGVLN